MDLRPTPGRPHLSHRMRLEHTDGAVRSDPNSCVFRSSSSTTMSSSSIISETRRSNAARHEDHLHGAHLLRASPSSPVPVGVRCNIEAVHRPSVEGIRTTYNIEAVHRPSVEGIRTTYNIEAVHRPSVEGIRTTYVERRDITRSLAYQGAVVGSPQRAANPSNRRVFYDTAAMQGPPLAIKATSTGVSLPQGSGEREATSRRISNQRNASSIFSN